MYFQAWNEYFISNQSHFHHIRFDEPDFFCVNEQKLFASSLQQFQRGEHSEGKHLFAFAKKYGDPDYIAAIKLFIKEEQDHANALGKFLKKHEIQLIRDHWVDGVFRQMRQLSGIENTVTVLLVAEIISKVYYKALKQATSSTLLKEICIQILKDEEKHLHFQCVTLKRLQLKRSFIPAALWTLYIKAVLSGTTIVVWKYHKNVLQKGGLNFGQFYNAIFSVLDDLLKMIKGQKEIPPALSKIQTELLIA